MSATQARFSESPAESTADDGLAGRVRRHEAEDIRRRQLIEATVEAIADVGFHAATILEIAGRAGVSAGLVAFYFRDKNGLLEATLRWLAVQLSNNLIALQRRATTPRGRLQAVVDATLGPSQFERRTSSVWLAFWAQVPVVPRFARIQRIYEARLASNLRAGWRSHPALARLDREMSIRLAATTAAMIDGLWLRATLSTDGRAASDARAAATAFVDERLALLDLALPCRGSSR